MQLPSTAEARKGANHRLKVSPLNMERRCSCAEVQILSAEACILVTRIARMTGIYSPGLKPTFRRAFRSRFKQQSLFVPAKLLDRWFYSPPASPVKLLQNLDFQRFTAGDKTARRTPVFLRANQRYNFHSPQEFLRVPLESLKDNILTLIHELFTPGFRPMKSSLFSRFQVRAGSGQKILPTQTACSPVSSVRMRIAFSIALTKTFPSPILPVFAAFTIASTAAVTSPSPSTTSTLIFGKKYTVYSRSEEHT